MGTVLSYLDYKNPALPQAQQATNESSSGLTGGAVCSLDARKRKNLQKEMDDQLAAAGGDREVTTTANMESSSSSAASADDQVLNLGLLRCDDDIVRCFK